LLLLHREGGMNHSIGRRIAKNRMESRIPSGTKKRFMICCRSGKFFGQGSRAGTRIKGIFRCLKKDLEVCNG